MFNPYLMRVSYVKIGTDHFRSYRGRISGFGYTAFARRKFKTATDTLAYTRRVLDRWRRLYGWAQFSAEQERNMKGRKV